MIRQSIKPQQLEALMEIYSLRDLPEPTRKAVRLRVVNGYTYEVAEFKTGVTRKRIAAAVKKLEEAHDLILKAYGV
ncbi:hypothetical protein [Photobacterium ganghwense]|uniref:hypothetical protein n=1 Tax=Photobacterium ganghwense TaxID=320778 RepID=UPI0039EF9219